jgi:hypothetical protein
MSRLCLEPPKTLIVAAAVVLQLLLVLHVVAQEPRLARRKTNMQAPPVADEAFKPLDQIQVVPRLDRPVLPEDRATDLFSPPAPASPEALRRADWQTSVYAWTPPEFFHRPLYFDDQPLERYGQSVHPRLQPAVSTGKFFKDVVFLPYYLVIDGHHQWVSPLGWDRPGSYATPIRERFPTLPGSYPRRGVTQRPNLEGQYPREGQ